MTTECLTHTWIEKSTRLKFALGGFLLHGARFQALVFQGHYGDIGTNPADPAPPLDDYPASVRCALINSHPIAGPLPRIALSERFIQYAPAQYRRLYVSINGDFQNYLKRFSCSRRKHLRRTLKQFGNLDWREYRRPQEMAEFHRLARGISRKTYQENLIDAGMPDGEAFLDFLNERAEHDGVRGYILFHEGTPVAYQYCRADTDDVLLCEKVGYDPAYRHLSPGTTLLYLVIERLFASRRFSRFDFGRGEFPYKETYATDWTRCADVYHFRRTFANYALVFGHTALDKCWAALAGLLASVGLRSRLKNLVRRHYVKH